MPGELQIADDVKHKNCCTPQIKKSLRKLDLVVIFLIVAKKNSAEGNKPRSPVFICCGRKRPGTVLNT